MTHSARRVFCKSTLTRSAFEKEDSFSKRDRKKAALSYSDNWEFADWKGFQKVLFRLQRRIFKAIKEGDKAKTKSLQKLILSSHSARMLATGYASPTCFARRIAQSDWQVTQLNTGSAT